MKVTLESDNHKLIQGMEKSYTTVRASCIK